MISNYVEWMSFDVIYKFNVDINLLNLFREVKVSKPFFLLLRNNVQSTNEHKKHQLDESLQWLSYHCASL